MGAPISNVTWRQHLATLEPKVSNAFDVDFHNRYGDRLWLPSDADKVAAHTFHIELVSRVATQPLGYSSGVEQQALASIFELFGHARATTQQWPDCQTFETIVWYVLNIYVRPFTAKWHSRSESGELNALDSSDIFRAELALVRGRLIELDRVLNSIRDCDGFATLIAGQSINRAVETEMDRTVGWRPMGETMHEPRSNLSEMEEEKVRERRKFYDVCERDWAAGLALSGGGIRSATFAIGIMVALSKRGLLPQFDYLSTVSGGGYAGSFLTQLLGTATSGSNLSLRRLDLPFKRSEGESELLRRIRQSSSYLSGSVWERFTLVMAQAQGIFLTLVIVLSLISVVAFGDYLLRYEISDEIWRQIALFSSAGLIALFLVVPLLRGWAGQSLSGGTNWLALLGALFVIPPLWVGLGSMHHLFDVLLSESLGVAQLIIIWTVVGSLVIVIGATFGRISLSRPIVLSAISIVILAVAEASAYRVFQVAGVGSAAMFTTGSVLISIALWFVLDINTTSLHNFYRTKLAKAFLVDEQCQPAEPAKLSNLDCSRSLFPILNCALNVPGSIDPKMRGRHADIMSFTPVAAGASLIGYSSITDWEEANSSLDLATAMALSGAAVSPQLGLQTRRYSSFWLTVLNLRLGAWLRNPKAIGRNIKRPTVKNLLQELLAMADEKGAYVQISDGGHIENLGVYELLRRRCRFIITVDGEQDEKMTFHGLTNLQRLAYIDFGIAIEANLEDLRISNEGLSRSHFRFCRIKYPTGESDRGEEIGYLVYLKLSLTGNEGEFIRRYKLDEPAFPHHSTANQFFTEVQFEAYRALGEHIGDKLFLPAITGLSDGPAIDIGDWFIGLGSAFLDPLP
ncbi:hypothetical protein AB7008_48165 [Bradyrhizobium sp. 521_C7_N1_3]|uniref:hypothetical protein n=1 Tax=Bradyrhizobium sp. 521_C7_N1_3 TaxID=3240368 RepID=UPI003F88E84A